MLADDQHHALDGATRNVLGAHRRAALALVCLIACGPSRVPAHGSGEGSGSDGATSTASATGEHPLGWSCGDGIVVTGEYCFIEHRLPGVLVSEIGVGDLDADGRDEIIVQTSDDIRSYAVHEDGSFELLQSWGDGDYDRPLVVGDFDSDGLRDVVRMDSGDADYFRQRADGSMELLGTHDPVTGLYTGGRLVFDADLDGREDMLLWIEDPSYELGPMRQAGHHLEDGAWVPTGTGIEFWSFLWDGVVADVDGDGHAEPIMLVWPEYAVDPPSSYPPTFDWKSVYLGHVKPDGSGLELGGKLTPGFYPTEIVVGDLDGDGNLDVILHGAPDYVYEEGASLNVIYWGHGDFTFDGPEPMGDAWGGVADVDGDGVAELLGTKDLVWRHVDGVLQAFEQPQPLIDARLGRRCDLNGDGVDDYVAHERPDAYEPSTNENTALIVTMSDP